MISLVLAGLLSPQQANPVDLAQLGYLTHAAPHVREAQAKVDPQLQAVGNLFQHVPFVIAPRKASVGEGAGPFDGLRQLHALGEGFLAKKNDLPAALASFTRLFPDAPKSEVSARPTSPRTGRELVSLLDRAVNLRGSALAKLTLARREELHARTTELVRNFWPQFNWNDAGRAIIAEDQKLLNAAWREVDWSQMIGAMELLYRVDPSLVSSSFSQAKTAQGVPGIQGDLHYAQKTPHGWIIVGGKGENVYSPSEPVAILIDLGGNDTYAGSSLGNSSATHGVCAIYDLAGDDQYMLTEFGLASGRLGVSLVRDFAGNDTYEAGMGGGGTGFGGIGVLEDLKGNDSYSGYRFSLGSAIGGIGLLIDRDGKDKYTADVLAIGVGGPCGVGGLYDQAGDDEYKLGFKHPSGYNGSDAPGGDPTHPNFQYEAWGLGMGIGRRVWPIPNWAEVSPYLAGGGYGFVIDSAGNDRYAASNFSLGCGYFFGAGLLLDEKGDDLYAAARYGMASGAHYAMGAFLELAGNDTYSSTGPTYNCGCSWDRSTFFFFEGAGNDTYDLSRSAGPGRGDIGSWGFAYEHGGDDTYKLTGLPGAASQNGLGVFLEMSGTDSYGGVQGENAPGNGKQLPSGEGGLFMDRN